MPTTTEKTTKKKMKTVKRPTSQDIGELRDAFSELHEALTAAYWAAGTMPDKDRIHGVQELVYDLLTDLNRADIASRTDELEALIEEIDDATDRLEALKEDIDDIIRAIKTVSEVVAAIEKALKLAARFVM